jgi:hypothetical protein
MLMGNIDPCAIEAMLRGSPRRSLLKYLLASAAALAVVIGLAAFSSPPSQVETKVHIDASAADVWGVLADTVRYPEWNPLIIESSGRWAVGETITNHMQFLDGTEPVFEPVLSVVEPARELRWLGQLWLPRIADGEHYFILTPVAEGTLLTHGENFEGLATWFFSAEMFAPDFERFNAALKTRVEGRRS